MPNSSHAVGRKHSQSPPAEPPTTTSYQSGYQQALSDFAITDLLHHLKTYSDAHFDAEWLTLKTQEAETLAAILIQSITDHLNGDLVAIYLNTMRCQSFDISHCFASLHLPPPVTALPADFPDVEMPHFLYGDRLRWLSNGETTDWGIAIGRFYSFAPHCCRWCWCYLIWLDADSPSAAWVKADIAWEDDLEPMDMEAS
jgi:hypothetical protein